MNFWTSAGKYGRGVIHFQGVAGDIISAEEVARQIKDALESGVESVPAGIPLTQQHYQSIKCRYKKDRDTITWSEFKP